MGNPLNASFSGDGGNWRRDNAGLLMPVGSGSGAKELIHLPKDIEAIAASANTLIKGNFTRELWPKLALLSTIAGPDHLRTKMFIANITAGSMAENSQATTNYLQGIVNMLVPSALPTPYGRYQSRGDGQKASKDGKAKAVEDE